jgi:transposase InsO family protein
MQTKHWEKAATKLSRRAGNFHVWKEELVRSLSAVAPLDRYIDHSPLIAGSFLAPPVLSAFPTYAEESNLHNYQENDANVRKLMRAVMEQDEWALVQNETSARSMFAAITLRHAAGTAVTLWTLWEKLLTISIDGTSADNIHKAVADSRTILDRIWAMGVPTRDTMRVGALLRAVNGFDKILPQLIDDVAKNRLTEDAIVRRLETEAELLSRNGLVADQYAAIVITDDTMCLRCSGFGHIARKCPSSPQVSEAAHVKAALAKRKDKHTPASAPKSNWRDRDGKKFPPKDGQRKRTGQAHALTLNGVTYVPSTSPVAAPAVADESASASGSDEEGAGAAAEWASALEVDMDNADSATLAAIMAAHAVLRPDTSIIGAASTEDHFLAALAGLTPLPATDGEQCTNAPHPLTVNPATVAYLGQDAWFLDSGATLHCTPEESDLEDVRDVSPIPIRGVGGDRMYARKSGSRVFRLPDGSTLTVSGVLVIPGASLRLISVGRLADAGMKTLFDHKRASVLSPRDDRVLVSATRVGTGLYAIDVGADHTVNAVQSGIPIATWHGRFGHPSADHIEKLVATHAVKGMHVDLSHRPPVCQPCIRGKQKRAAVPKRRAGERAAAFLDLVYVDLTGSQERVATPNGEHYTMNLLDDHTSWPWTFLLKSKDEALPTLIAWHARICRKTGRTLGALNIDNGELRSHALEAWAAPRGITVRFTSPYTSSDNGRVERLHHSIDNCGRAMRIAAGLPETTWGEFVKTASYLFRYRVTKTLPNGVTPYEARFGKKPDVSHLREVGCKAFVLIQNQHVTKIQPKSLEAVFVGYDPTSKSYRLWHRQLRKVMISRNVVFVETHQLAPTPLKPGVSVGAHDPTSPSAPTGWPDPADPPACAPAVPPRVDLPEPSAPPPSSTVPNVSESIPPDEPVADMPRPKRATRAPVKPDSENPLRDRMREDIRAGADRARKRRADGKGPGYDAYVEVERDHSLPEEDVLGAVREEEVSGSELFGEMLDDELVELLASLDVPADDDATLTLKEALAGPEREQWRQALIDEFTSIEKMGVFRLIRRSDVPAGRRILRGKAVLKRKRNEHGAIVRWKARWVVKGFLQVFGLDYNKTTSPTARLETLRILCHIVATHDLELRQFDVKTAFLHGDLPEDERIYMEQPPGFEDPARPDDIWEVLKGIYGMKQAGRVWNKRLNGDMTAGFGFHRVSAEHCLYFRRAENGNFALASIHVDDTTAVGHKEELDRLEQDLRSRYEITVSDGSYMLGIHVQRDRERRLHQQTRLGLEVL